MEKVLVVAVDSNEKIFIQCYPYVSDFQLEMDVTNDIGECTFFVVYDEDLDELEDALDEMYIPIRKGKKLTYEDRRVIRDMIKSGDFTQKEVAANYGVSRQTVWKVCKNEN